MICRNCKNKIVKIIKLGKQPLSGVFLPQKKKNLNKYSLDLFICKFCNLVQLGETPPPKKMFGYSYGYQTSLSKLMINHIKKKITSIKNYLPNLKNLKILDIGSNDGTFLNCFKNNNFLVGVDPTANKFKYNYKKKIKVINNFFNKKNLFKSLKEKKNIRFDLIASFAMYYDVENPNTFCSEVSSLLKSNGIWIVEFSYLPLMLKNLTFDQICHEHLTYNSLKVFNSIIKNNFLKILNVSTNEINGGSVEIICSRQDSNYKKNIKVINQYINDEEKIKLQSYKRFNERVKRTKNDINFFFQKFKNKNIIGYGASTKGNIILNYCNINNKSLKFICDNNINKIGKFTPGSNIKIISKKNMRIMKPDFLFVLIWSFRKEIIQEEIEYINSGGKLVFPLPKLHIIDKTNYKKYLNSTFKHLSFNY